MSRRYTYGRQTIEDDDVEAVARVLRSDWLTQGPAVAAFEEALGATLGASHVAAVSNGTAALHLIALALGWGPGDTVVTSAITFLASANCILYAGATPEFLDIDPARYTLDLDLLEEYLRRSWKSGKKVKAVVAVDYAGQPCDWQRLRSLADDNGLQLVNDCCHALGAEYQGSIAYAARYADAVSLSFHPVKHITTAEGGAVVTNSPAIDRTVRMLRTHGMTKDPAMLRSTEGPWYYEMQHLGFNYRLSDLQSALGMCQLRKLPRFLEERRRIAAFYDGRFSNDERFQVPRVAGDVVHAYHLYPLRIRFGRLPVSRRMLFERLSAAGIACQVHYFPVPLQPYYSDRFGFGAASYARAVEFYNEEVSLPMYPGLTESDLVYVCDALTEALV